MRGSDTTPPSCPESERAVMASILGGTPIDAVPLEAGHFYNETHKLAFVAAASLAADGAPISLEGVTTRLRSDGKLEQAGGAGALTEIANAGPGGTATVLHHFEYLEESRQRRATLEYLARTERDLREGRVTASAFVSELAERATPIVAQGLDMLDSRRFNHSAPIAEPPALYSIGTAKICTPGNLTNISAQAKSGKSAALGAMLAAGMNPEATEDACLGFRAHNPEGLAIVHFDTEQSRYDHHLLIVRALRRAGLDEPPQFLRSYCVTDLAMKQRREALWREMERAGRLFAVLLDGVADFIADPNDPEGAFAFVAELHARAIQHECAIISVLHENPGSESGKTRGHLGSQLERKAETCLRLAKSDEVTTLWAEKARHCSLPKSQGVRFEWSILAEMHVMAESANDARSRAALDDLTAFAASCFEAGSPLSWAALRDRIKLVGGVKDTGAIKKINRMREAGIIQKNLMHEWEFAT